MATGSSDNDVYWAPPGVTPHAQVQDASGTPGAVLDIATNEMAVLDVIGYTLAAYSQPAPTLSLVRNAPGNFTLSWTPNTPGFSLQESTSLLPSSWVASATGSANPASITTTAVQKFYRLSKGVTPSVHPALNLASQARTAVPFKQCTHLLRRRQS